MKEQGKKLKKVILFYNPNSGDGLFISSLDHIIGRYEKAGYLVIAIRAAYNHMIFDFLGELDQETYREEYRQVMVMGGDGTLNVCVNAMLHYHIDLPLALIPVGTANDFASYFDLPSDFDKLLDIALDDHYTYADVGKVNDRYFVNMAIIGQGLGINKNTDPALKTIFGILAYYLKMLMEIPRIKSRQVELITQEGTYREKMYFMIVMNGESVSGLKRVSPESQINDGLLDVLVVRRVSPIKVPLLFARIVHGNHQDSGEILRFSTNSLRVECDEELPTDLDGEGSVAAPLIFTVLPKKLRIHTRREQGEE